MSKLTELLLVINSLQILYDTIVFKMQTTFLTRRNIPNEETALIKSFKIKIYVIVKSLLGCWNGRNTNEMKYKVKELLKTAFKFSVISYLIQLNYQRNDHIVSLSTSKLSKPTTLVRIKDKNGS